MSQVAFFHKVGIVIDSAKTGKKEYLGYNYLVDWTTYKDKNGVKVVNDSGSELRFDDDAMTSSKYSMYDVWIKKYDNGNFGAKIKCRDGYYVNYFMNVSGSGNYITQDGSSVYTPCWFYAENKTIKFLYDGSKRDDGYFVDWESERQWLKYGKGKGDIFRFQFNNSLIPDDSKYKAE